MLRLFRNPLEYDGSFNDTRTASVSLNDARDPLNILANDDRFLRRRGTVKEIREVSEFITKCLQVTCQTLIFVSSGVIISPQFIGQ